ncbi:hypothetical protein TNCV_2257611 [Trichonephila clavipes]|nr:hypothetical protein TNCV_2257611 [Trichonephila clavipes]
MMRRKKFSTAGHGTKMMRGSKGYLSERKGVDGGVSPGSEFAFQTGGFSGRRKREKASRNGVYVRFKVDRTTSKKYATDSLPSNHHPDWTQQSTKEHNLAGHKVR